MTKRARGPPKLPSKQLAILAICRFAEPVTLTSIFPYLPEMIESFGIKKKDVAKWAGLTSAVFSLSQCFSAVLWGRASDKYGRKPTILIGLVCTMIFTLMWGVSTTLPMAIISRALSGVCNGNVGIIRTMVAEMVPEKELQPRAFSIMPLVWSLGSIFGPSFGGFFSKPSENFPNLFGDSKFFQKYPFALPNIVASVLFMAGISTGILFLRETLESKRHKKDYGLKLGSKLTTLLKTLFRLHPAPKPFRRNSTTHNDQAASLLRPTSSSSTHRPQSHSQKPPLPRPSLKEVLNRQSVINLITYTFLALHSVAYDQLLPIFLHHPRQIPTSENTSLPFKFSGGYGLKANRIGTIFTLYGICGCFIQFLVFPPVARRYGVLNCFKACGLVFPIVCFVTPYTALIQDPLRQQASLLLIMLLKCFAVIFAFPCSIILLTNSASSLRILGTLNGVAVSVSAIGRALGPALGGATFTWGLERGYVIPPWWLLGIIAAIGAVPIWWLEEMEGFGSRSDDEDEGEDGEEEESLLPDVFEDEEDEDRSILGGDEVFEDEYEEERGKKGGLERIGERRLSSPIGVRESVGRGGGRRLSNGLAASNNGQGIGGTSFN